MEILSQSSLWDKEYSQSLIWNRKTSTLPKIINGKSVLELGVGNGKTLLSILQQKPKSVHALDFSKEAIKTCACQPKFSGVEFVISDILDLPFKEETFDVVICYYVLNALLKKDRQKAILEIKRVLKSNGTFLFEDFAEGDFRQAQSEKEVEKNTIQKKSGIICHFFKKEEVSELFKEFKISKISHNIFKPFKTHNTHIHRSIIQSISIKK